MDGNMGNGLGQRVALQSVGLGVAEGVSIITSLGVVAFADQIAGKPLQAVSKMLARTVVEPYLEKIEAGLSAVCKLEECKQDEKFSRSERAEALAHNLIVFGASWAAAMGSKIAARKFCNEHLGISAHEPDAPWWKFWKMNKADRLIFAADEGVHYGSLLLLNTGAAKHTDDMIRATTDLLMKCGMEEKKAHELATYTYVWEMPNVLGFAAGVGAIYQANKWGWMNGGGHGHA